MDRESLRTFRRLQKDMLRTEKAYVRALMKALDEKNVDLAALQGLQDRFEAAIGEFKDALSD
ncbi:hypothetical protein [Peptoniphilus sp. HCN-40583]|uniref:hypothetical protein n=1 Tax=Peptoniphilus sp. HCN-40583 TaxID=3134662 RepID=UPI0030BA43C8